MKNKTYKRKKLLSLLKICILLSGLTIVAFSIHHANAIEQEKNIVMLSGSGGRSDDVVLISGTNKYKEPLTTLPLTKFTDIKYNSFININRV